MINARVESLTERGIFRAALASRRCLVVIDGFYEWTRDKPRHTPHYVKRADGRPMALAGLWAGAGQLESCTIVTVPALPPVAKIHDRMPLVVSPDLFDEWLDPSRRTAADLARVLGAKLEGGGLTSYPVHPRVNRAAEDGPENIVPFELQRTLFG